MNKKKVKIITEKGFEQLESSINDFLEDAGELVDVKYTPNFQQEYMALVIYEAKKG